MILVPFIGNSEGSTSAGCIGQYYAMF